MWLKIWQEVIHHSLSLYWVMVFSVLFCFQLMKLPRFQWAPQIRTKRFAPGDPALCISETERKAEGWRQRIVLWLRGVIQFQTWGHKLIKMVVRKFDLMCNECSDIRNWHRLPRNKECTKKTQNHIGVLNEHCHGILSYFGWVQNCP